MLVSVGDRSRPLCPPLVLLYVIGVHAATIVFPPPPSSPSSPSSSVSSLSSSLSLIYPAVSSPPSPKRVLPPPLSPYHRPGKSSTPSERNFTSAVSLPPYPPAVAFPFAAMSVPPAVVSGQPSLPVQLALQELSRLRNRLEKLHHSTQSLNDLLADLFARPASLRQLTNSSTLLLHFDQMLSDLPLRLPRKLQVFIAQLASGNLSDSGGGHNNNNNEAIDRQSLQENLLDLSSASNDVLMSSHRKSASNNSNNNNSNNNSNNNNNKIKLSKKKKPSATTLVSSTGRCYEPYGCFRITDPYRTILRPINLPPEPPDTVKVAFYLRTRRNPNAAERLAFGETSKVLQSQYFRPEHRVRIIIHGYLESWEESWCKEMSSALLNREDANVISVDWQHGAKGAYIQSVANTRLVGAIVARFVQTIQETYPGGYPSARIHIIGHSLGAHIAGYAGQSIPNLGRITGLDPAEPYFQYTDPVVRLDPTDATFVDVVHTDVASIITGGFGMNQTCGHVDFYPNGGEDQPGCKETPIKNVLDSISKERTVFDGIRRFIGCNHLRSFLLFIEAINSECPFMAYPCRSYEDFELGQCTSRQYSWSLYPRRCGLLAHYTYPPVVRRPSPSLVSSDPASAAANQTKLLTPSAALGNLPVTFASCPIRMGLESEDDYYLNQLVTSGGGGGDQLSDDKSTGVPVSNQLYYFLQTNDRATFCQYHYQIRLVVLFAQHRLFRSYRSFSLDNWVLNGRLTITLVGSRHRSSKEIVLKQHHSAEGTRKADHHRLGNVNLKEYTLLVANKNLGTILRIELEWRPSPQAQRSLMVMQSKAVRRWWPQLTSLEYTPVTLLPGVLNELQKTINTTTNNLIPSSALQLSPNWLNDILKNIKSEQSVVTTPPPPPQPPTTTTGVTETVAGGGGGHPKDVTTSQLILPTLEGVLITQLETGERLTFCANEIEARTLFQTKSSHKSAVLLTTTAWRSHQWEQEVVDRRDIFEVCNE